MPTAVVIVVVVVVVVAVRCFDSAHGASKANVLLCSNATFGGGSDANAIYILRSIRVNAEMYVRSRHARTYTHS